MNLPEATQPPRLTFDVRGVNVYLGNRARQRHVLKDVSLRVMEGRTTIILGESASGKSVLLKTLLGLHVDRPGAVSGSIVLSCPGKPPLELLEGLSEAASNGRWGGWQVSAAWQRQQQRRIGPLRGTVLGFVGQHGAAALDPTRPVLASLGEAFRLKARETGRSLNEEQEAHKLLTQLGFSEPGAALRCYPCELSGGMAQRAALAVSLARGAAILFADEPTTGLDPASQDALLNLLKQLKDSGRLQTLLLVTHDLGVARTLGDDIVVIHEGRVLETLTCEEFFNGAGPSHAVTRQLKAKFEALGKSRRAAAEPGGDGPAELRLQVKGLVKRYLRREGRFRWLHKTILSGVDLELQAGDIVGIVGPSGQGKTTLAACLVRLVTPDAGQVLLNGSPVQSLRGQALRALRRRCQLLFQHPMAALHPRMTVQRGLLETATRLLGLPRREALARVQEVCERLRLDQHLQSYPAQLSGGQLRRVGLARVLLLEPEVLIADEPTAGIDASLRAELLDELFKLTTGPAKTAIILISHDRAVISHMAYRIYKMEAGAIIETSSSELWQECGKVAAPENALEVCA